MYRIRCVVDVLLAIKRGGECMAFIGMVFVAIFFMMAIMMILILITAFILKFVGKRKQSRRMRIVGNILLVIGFVLAIPVVFVIGNIVYKSKYEEVYMPDGKTAHVSKKYIEKMNEIIFMNDKNMDALVELLDEEPKLIYYLDDKHKGILEYGLENGDYELVEIAIEHGAIFDNPNRYDHMAYEDNSMDFYLSSIFERTLTSEDIDIITLMFDSNVSMDYSMRYSSRYSNLYGKAVWLVLNNDEYVTETEIEFIHKFIENGFSEDDKLNLSESNRAVVKDDNYYLLMKMIDGLD